VVGESEAPGTGHGSTGAEAELDLEERWLRLWAFSTSLDGLAIPEDKFWHLSPREWMALKDVFDRKLKLWAIERADYRNVNFLEHNERGEVTGEPWIPEDFLGTGNRVARSIENAQSKIEVIQANTYLNKITRDAPAPDELPSWARG
jgi:hypothetical protein